MKIRLVIILIIMAVLGLALTSCALMKAAAIEGNSALTPPDGFKADPKESTIKTIIVTTLKPYLGPTIAYFVTTLIILGLYAAGVLKHQKTSKLLSTASQGLELARDVAGDIEIGEIMKTVASKNNVLKDLTDFYHKTPQYKNRKQKELGQVLDRAPQEPEEK